MTRPLVLLRRIAALGGTLIAVACAATAPRPTPPARPAVAIPVVPPRVQSGDSKFDAFLEAMRTEALAQGIRPEVFDALRVRRGSFLDGVLAGMFTVPGDGALDYGEVMRVVAEIGYSGWVIIEAEQDPAIADPRQYGEVGLRTLERCAERAGLREATA